jgi:hypothetical protein
MQYYLHDGKEQHGPFSLDELRSHSLLKPDTPIWHEGMSNWVKAKEVEELKTLFKPPPPTLSKPPTYTSSESQSVVSKPKSKSRWSVLTSWKTIAVAVLVLVLGYAAYAMYDNKQQEKQEQERNRQEQERKQREEEKLKQEEQVRVQIRNNIRYYVQAHGSDYQTRAIGGIYGLSIDVTNQTDYLIDNVRVLVRYIKANGETWKEEALDFALIPPNKKMTLRAPDSDRGTSIDYKIVSIRSTALGL